MVEQPFQLTASACGDYSISPLCRGRHRYVCAGAQQRTAARSIRARIDDVAATRPESSSSPRPKHTKRSPQNDHDPDFRGRGSYFEQMAEREGFEPSDEVSPVTRFPVAPVQPLRHLSRHAGRSEVSSTSDRWRWTRAYLEPSARPRRGPDAIAGPGREQAPSATLRGR